MPFKKKYSIKLRSYEQSHLKTFLLSAYNKLKSVYEGEIELEYYHEN
jgi:hypothetical protein